MHQEPLRTCAGCRKRKPQRALLRVARLADGTVLVDSIGAARAQGRGAYVCPSEGCVDAALRPGGLARIFKCKEALPEDLRARLLGRIEGSGTVRGPDLAERD